MCLLAGRLIVRAQRHDYWLDADQKGIQNYSRPTMNDMNIKTGVQTVLSRSYLVSLPERTTRAGAALTGGLAYEASEVVLPLSVT